MAEVLIEEGQRVEQGQVIARLDSSNTGAALAEAQARLALAQAEHGRRPASLPKTPTVSSIAMSCNMPPD